MYEVGLGDSPQRIARALTGDPRRYRELLAANPHKPVVLVRGEPTFASLGVGERLNIPRAFGVHGEDCCAECGSLSGCGCIRMVPLTDGVSGGWDGGVSLADLGLGSSYGDALAKVGLHPDNPDQMFDRLMYFAHHPVAFKTEDKNWRGARDNKTWWESPKGVAQIQWPFHGGKWLDNVPKTEPQIRAVFKIPNGVGTKQFLANLFGFPFRSDMRYALHWEEWKQDGGGFSLDPSRINVSVDIDPGKIIKQLDPHINVDPGKILHQIGLPTPDDMLHQIGLPSLSKMLSDAGIPTDPANIFKDIINPTLLVAQLAEHLPGIKEVAKYIPSMPDPTQMAENIVSAATSGDLDKLKGAVLDVGHEVADTLSMVPGLGSGIAGPLDAAIALLESGSALRAALDLLLSEIPDIPPQIRDVFLRPAINAVSDIVDHGKSLSDAFISSFKEGVMAEAKAKGFPSQLVGIISGFIDAVIQVILQHKPLDQAATGLAQKGLETAMTAAVGQVGASGGDLLKQLPSIPGGDDLLKKLPSLPGGGDLLKKLPSLPVGGTDIAKQISALPGGAELLKKIPSSADLQKALLQKTFDAVKSKIPADVTNKVASLQQAYDTVKSVGNDSNTIHSLSQGIIALAKKDPKKADPTIQKQIAGLKTAIEAHRASIRSSTKKLDANLGTPPTKHHGAQWL